MSENGRKTPEDSNKTSSGRRLDYPRCESAGWLVAPDTPFIPDVYWLFYDTAAVISQDDQLVAAQAAEFLRVQTGTLDMLWTSPRTREMLIYWNQTALALRRAMSCVLDFAPLHLSPDECSIIERGDDAIKAALQEYDTTTGEIRFRSGRAEMPGANLVAQSVEAFNVGNRPLADVLMAADKANPFRENPALCELCRILRRLESKLRLQAKASQKADGSPADSEDQSKASQSAQRHHRQLPIEEETRRAQIILAYEHNARLPADQKMTRRQFCKVFRIHEKEKFKGKASLKATETWAKSESGKLFLSEYRESADGCLWMEGLPQKLSRIASKEGAR